jgi:hypothetical protein
MKLQHTLSTTLGVAAAAFVLVAGVTTAGAEIYTIDDSSPGAVYNGILDGFPLPPPGTAPDGNGDQLAGSLGIALQTGVTEERGIAELPLAQLDGIGAGDVVSATLTFNIDDVVGTFGPGTTFDGTAASSIVLFAYAGNGTVDLADFGNVGGAPLSVVSTALHGTITDATLSSTGALAFEVDVTAAIVARLTGGDDFLGFVFATQDAGSGTSLDNLGNAGSGPAGVSGSSLPYLTIVTTTDAPPVYGKAELKCQKSLAKASARLQQSLRGALGKCLDAVLGDLAKGGNGSAATAACAGGLDGDSADSTLSKAMAKHESSIAGACEGLTPSSIGSPCDATATTFAQTAACLADGEASRAQASARAAYDGACSLLDAAGLASDFTVICAAD